MLISFFKKDRISITQITIMSFFKKDRMPTTSNNNNVFLSKRMKCSADTIMSINNCEIMSSTHCIYRHILVFGFIVTKHIFLKNIPSYFMYIIIKQFSQLSIIYFMIFCTVLQIHNSGISVSLYSSVN